MENGITIKTITSLDTLERCVDIMVEAYSRPPWNNTWTADTAKALLNCYYNTPNFMGWIAIADDKIIGCATGNAEPYYEGSMFYLRELFVDIDYQNNGIGTLLMDTLKSDLNLQGINNMMLFTYKALGDFYKRFDFDELEDICVMICE